MARWRFTRAAILVVIASLILPAGPVAATQDPACSDVQLVWARGTGRVVGSDNEFATINDQLRGRLGALVESSYQLGGDGGFGGFSYSAGGGGLGLFFNWTLPEVGAYSDSVSQGKQELNAYLAHRTVECPNEVYVLAGWSQGAQVIGEGLFLLNQAVRRYRAGAAVIAFARPANTLGDRGGTWLDRAPGERGHVQDPERPLVDGDWARGDPAAAG